MGSSSRASTTTAQTTTQVSRNLNLQDTEGVTIGEAGGNVTVVSTDHNAFADASALARNAVDVAESIGLEALDLSLQQIREVSGTLLDLSTGAISEIGNIAGSALTFGDRAFGTVEKALGSVSGAYQDAAAYQKAALSEVALTNERAIDALRDTQTGALATVTNVFRDAFLTNERAVDALKDTQTGALSTVTSVFRDAFIGITSFVENLQGKAQEQLGDTVTALNAIAVEQNKSTDQRLQESTEKMLKYTLIGFGVLVVGFIGVSLLRKS